MSPVRPTAASNALTCASAFWPVLASSTSSVSCGRRRVGLADHALDLADLVHQVRAASAAGRRCRRARRRCRAPWRRAMASNMTAAGSPPVLRDHRDAVALAPDRELLARRGAEGVAGGEQHRLALLLQPLGELADRRRLAGAVDAGQHDHERPRRGRPRAASRAARAGRAAPPCSSGLGSASSPARFQRAWRSSSRCCGRVHADVGGEERRLELLERLVVELAAREHAGQRAGELLARQAEPGLEPLGPRALRLGGVRGAARLAAVERRARDGVGRRASSNEVEHGDRAGERCARAKARILPVPPPVRRPDPVPTSHRPTASASSAARCRGRVVRFPARRGPAARRPTASARRCSTGWGRT